MAATSSRRCRAGGNPFSRRGDTPAHGHRHQRPGRPARRAARLGAAAGPALAGRDARSARRAPGLPAGVRPPARARRLCARQPGAAHRAGARRGAGAAGGAALRARHAGQPRRWASACAAAYLQAAPAEALNGPEGVAAFDALGTHGRPAGATGVIRNLAHQAAGGGAVRAPGCGAVLRRQLRQLRARGQDDDLLRRRGLQARAGDERRRPNNARAPRWR